MNLDTPAPSVSLWTSLGEVFRLTLRQLIRGRRLLILSIVFALPAILALVFRSAPRAPRPQEIEIAILFYFLPMGLIPATCLLYASGMIQDEIEEQTLTYLLVRPIPRTLIYLTRLLATYLVTVTLALFFTTLTAICIWWGSNQMFTVLRDRVVPLLAILVLAVFVYTAIFGCLGLYFRRLLAMGIAYILIVEYFLASIDFVIRKMTVTYYFRILVLNWIDNQEERTWRISLGDPTTPSPLEAVITLIFGGLALAALGMLIFRATEYKMKTAGES
jgi:ABC-2 type transport system permease protein